MEMNFHALDTSGASSFRAFRAPLLETCWKHPYLLGGLMKKIWFCIPLLSLLALPQSPRKNKKKKIKRKPPRKRRQSLQGNFFDAPDSIPQDILDKTDCVVILPSVLKFAIGFGAAMPRCDDLPRGSNFNGPWGPPTMMALEGGSAGLQLGGNATDFVLLLMSPRSASSMLSSKVKLGG